MTRFYLIRHGEKATPDRILATRSPGVNLTARGREQSEAIAAFLADQPVDHVVSSPMERAQQTAAPLAKQRGLQVEIDTSFHEFDFGEWTMKSIDDLHGGKVWNNFISFRSCTTTPGGESMLQVQSRVIAGLMTLRDRFPSKSVAVVCHGDPIRAAVCYFAGAPLDFWHRFEISVGSITTIDLSDCHVQIQQMNRVPWPR